MELCQGGCLQSKFDSGPMLLADVRKYATHITMGLAALHARNMLHRDIKPANILLNKQGIAKLGDFGLVTDNIILG
jgi:eukaryotic-like serine/threonine-protein kinase